MQLGGVMEGKHSIDTGMLVLPVLIELIMLIGDVAKVDYVSGLEKETKLDSSLIDLAVEKFKKEQNKTQELEVAEEEEEEMEKPVEERTGGLMSRSM
jgi:spore coat protein CotH